LPLPTFQPFEGEDQDVNLPIRDSRDQEKHVQPHAIYVVFVVWENPNPSNKCVTQLGTPITVTSIDIPLVLVMDKSNTREASRVTLGGLQGERPREEGTTPIGHNERFLRLDGG
jgi:hypothetical protein